MEKIRIKELIKFRRKSDRSRITLVNNLKLNKALENDSSSGGDYWISCLSAIANAFKYDNIELLDEKIDLLIEKIRTHEDKRIKNQFQRNIDVLYNFEDFDFQELKPNADLIFLKKPTDISILDIKELPIQAKPDHVFTFSINNSEEIGAVWFIAQLDGFDKGELGMFVDILHRYLIKHFSKDFFVNTSNCIAVDVNKAQYVSYKDIEEGKIPNLLEQTIDDIKKLL
ncbi:hypothetical protein ACT3CD_16620 [Geofilum sp. OHC36d9]|uniref:hypothetical protein n=1 Tax=Geofilum sp. OHC36d9 TaxID=3458413 RepID=UPI0040341D0C